MANEAPLLTMDQEQARDTALVDLAYGVLRETNQPFNFRDLMQEIAKLRGMTEKEIEQTIAMLYTEINIDGRFLCIGNNVWGLKRWYPVDKTVEKATGKKKFVRKEIDALYEDEDEDEDLDEDLYLDDEPDEEELEFAVEEEEEDVDLKDTKLEEDADEFSDETVEEDLDISDNEEDEEF